MKKIVITGGPHAGKTTLISELQKRGHICTEEAGMQVFEQLNNELGVPGQIRWREQNGSKLQAMIINKQTEIEHCAQQSAADYVFLDRGQHDSLAYIELNNRPLPADFSTMLSHHAYQQVFVLDVITPFDMRGETGRTLTYQDALLENEKLTDVYQRYDHTVIKVPQLALAERVEYILSRLK